MKTTLNIGVDILNQIKKAAKSKGISSSDMILFLLSKVAGEIGNHGKIGRLIRYQARRHPDEWHTFHISVREDMFEYWLDLKKLLKVSVSFALADAVEKYLGELTKIRCGDNYLCKNYIIEKVVIDSFVMWKFIWGFPPKLDKFIHHY